MSRENIEVRLGKRIRYLRKKAGLTQPEMSHRFGIDRGHISELENGKRSPGLPMLETLAAGFKMTISELMRGV